jgi:hypothetical protein
LAAAADNTPNLLAGVVVKADALALWTEDAFPPALFSAWGSADGVVYVRLASAVAVQTDGLGVDSSAQRVDLTPFHLRHLWLQISCRPNDSACSIGEVALRAEAFRPRAAPATRCRRPAGPGGMAPPRRGAA